MPRVRRIASIIGFGSSTKSAPPACGEENDWREQGGGGGRGERASLAWVTGVEELPNGNLLVTGDFQTTGGRTAVNWSVFSGCCGRGLHACSRADWNDDGAVDLNDWLAFFNAYNAGDRCADVDGNGGVDIQDFLAFGELFARGC